MDACRRLRNDRGETLVEVLVAVVILGLAGVAVLAGMALSIRASDIHRKATTGGAQVRTYAEDIQSFVSSSFSNYKNCPTGATYGMAAVGFVKPDRFKDPTYTVASIKQDAAGKIVTVPCSDDVGLQLVTLSLASNDGLANEQLTFVLRRPCEPGPSVCA